MFDFIVGYVLGSATRNGPGISARSLGIVFLSLVALSGIGWFVLGVIHADQSVVECGGTAIQDSYCRALASAKTIGLLILGGVAGLAVLWALVAQLKKG